MKLTCHLKTLMLVFAISGSFAVYAEDIDIFNADQTTTGTRPNVLLVLDNAASNNSSVTMLNGSKGDKLEMLREVLTNIADPLNSPYFPSCTVTVVAGIESRNPAKCVTRGEVDTLLKSINLGLMIFNPSGNGKGAYVRYHIRPMDVAANRTGFIGKINPGIPQANNAPYAKTMYEAYQYFGARPAYVGFDSNLYDSGAKNPLNSNYISPAADGCAANYIIYVGNGGPDSSENGDAQTLLTGIGGKQSNDPIQFSPNNFTGNWFDEFARTLKRQDVAPAVGVQNVTTYTIAIQNPDDNNFSTAPNTSARELLNSGATQGGGEFYLASNGHAAMRAFVELLQKMQDVSSVFTSITLPVSMNVRGQSLNQVYMGQFRPDKNRKPRWVGNLKAYKITGFLMTDRADKPVEDTVNGFLRSDVTSYWTTPSSYWAFNPIGNPPSSSDAPDGAMVEKGGAAQRMRTTFATSQASRKLYTCTGTCSTTAGSLLSDTVFDVSNNDVSSALLGATDATERTNIINWVRGQDNMDNEDLNGVTTDVRAGIHGDILHSRPAVVNYNRASMPVDRDVLIFYGANDGVFHAIKGGLNNADGGEKWGVVFPEFFGKLKTLRENTPIITTATPKPYFADGPVSVYQKDVNGDGRLLASDGDKVYLYIGMRRGGRFMYGLDASNPDSPKFLWKIDNTGDFAELGQTWSSPRAAKVKALTTDPMLFIGAGYDAENEDALPATANNKGRGIFVVNGRTGAFIKHIMPAGMGAVVGDLTLIDRNGDGFDDRIYAADTKGNLWRVDIDDADISKWEIYKIATLGGTGSNARKFLMKPDVILGTTYDAVMLGSGDREHPTDTSVTDRIYMIKDSNVGLTGAALNITHTDLADVTTNPYQSAPLPISKKGWYLTLMVGEKVVANAYTDAGTTFLPTNRPTPAAPGVCSPNLGEAALWAIGFETGNATFDWNADGLVNADDRKDVLAGGGFPPGVIAAKTCDENGANCTTTVCSGAHCVPPPNPPLDNRRYRTYWHKKTE